MKKKMLLMIMISLVLCCMMACGKEKETEVASSEKEVEVASDTLDEEQEAIVEDDKEENQELAEDVQEPIVDEYMLAYADAIDALIYDGVFPDGTQVEYMEDFGEIEDNEFAVCDVDGDGIKELIIIWSTAPTAGMIGYVVQYMPEEKSFKTEICEYPGFRFFPNGLLTVDLSHNHGMGELWPYAIFKYNENKNEYEIVGQVEGWCKEIADKDYNGNPYPDAVDTDGIGQVYSIQYGQDYKGEFKYSQKDYDNFYAKTFSDGFEIALTYHKLRGYLAEKLREGTLDPVITGKLVEPMTYPIDTDNLEDGIYPVDIKSENVWDDNGKVFVYMTVCETEIYDIVDMNTLAVGDGIECNGEVTKINSVEDKDGVIIINGGLDEGGLEFRAVDESNCYVYFGFNDMMSYEEFGDAYIELDDKCVITDTARIYTEQDERYTPAEFAEAMHQYNMHYTRFGTKARVENGKVVEINTVYTP